MFKLALDAGHGKNTAGKRCLKSLDKNETREWVLNSRIAEKIQKYLSEYEGIAIKRMDDTSGETDVSLDTRTKTANKFDADLYLSLHHNAGVEGGAGGGLIVIRQKGLSADGETGKIQKKFYNALIKSGVPKGNRANPTPAQDLHVLRETSMPAVLIEFGFMDSATDIKYILTDEFADIAAKGCVNTIVELGKLKKKEQTVEEKPDESLKNEPIEVKQPETEPKQETTTEEVQPTTKENEEIVSDNSIIKEETQKTENTLIELIKLIVELIKKILNKEK